LRTKVQNDYLKSFAGEPQALIRTFLNLNGRPKPHGNDQRLWFVTDFHPILYKPIRRAIARARDNLHVVRPVFDTLPCVGCAFRSHGPPLIQRLKRY
jgi:hypothetical protein